MMKWNLRQSLKPLMRSRAILYILLFLVLGYWSVCFLVPLATDLVRLDGVEKTKASGSLVRRIPGSVDPHVCSQKTVAVMTVVRDFESWGPHRSFWNHLQMVRAFGYPSSCISINVIVSNVMEF